MLHNGKTLIDETIDKIEEKIGITDKPYDASKWVSEQIEQKGLKETKITTFARKKSFEQLCKIVRKELQEEVFKDATDKESQKEKENEWLDRQFKAVTGNAQAMGYFISKIKEVLRKNNITSTDYPSFYDSLSEAIFHHVWGVGILHKWEKYPDSEAAVIRGTELWIDINGQFVKQPEQFESMEQVERIKRTFIDRIEDAVINKQNPELEIEREDGSRITMIQKPRARVNYVMFRRFIVRNISLYEQARLSTIREEDIDIFRALSRTKANIVFAGPVRSAKSTFMKTMIRERDPKEVPAVMEKHFELALTEHFPERLIFEVQAKEGDLHHAMPRLLRMEHDYMVIGEMRSLEAEGYMYGCERGVRGAFSTYHLTDVKNVVAQITRHILDEFPNRNFENELERVARNIDIIVTMMIDKKDKTKKRVAGVTEVIWDDETRTHKTQDLIRYSEVTDRYYYSSNITKNLLYLMAQKDLEETKRLLKLLKQREKESPLSEYEAIEDNIVDILLGDELDG